MQNTLSLEPGDEHGPISLAVKLILEDEPLPVSLQDDLISRGYSNLDDFKKWVLSVRH